MALNPLIIPSLISAGAGIFSAFSASKGGREYAEGASAQQSFNAQQAQLNRDFQECMSVS